MVFATWCWASPFSILPLLKVWGQYTSGKNLLLPTESNSFEVRFWPRSSCFPSTVSEGFLTTCSFDFLTDDQDTKGFVVGIFIWSYALPLMLIIYFYSLLLQSIRNHEKMLREQVYPRCFYVSAGKAICRS